MRAKQLSYMQGYIFITGTLYNFAFYEIMFSVQQDTCLKLIINKKENVGSYNNFIFNIIRN